MIRHEAEIPSEQRLDGTRGATGILVGIAAIFSGAAMYHRIVSKRSQFKDELFNSLSDSPRVGRDEGGRYVRVDSVKCIDRIFGSYLKVGFSLVSARPARADLRLLSESAPVLTEFAPTGNQRIGVYTFHCKGNAARELQEFTDFASSLLQQEVSSVLTSASDSLLQADPPR